MGKVYSWYSGDEKTVQKVELVNSTNVICMISVGGLFIDHIE